MRGGRRWNAAHVALVYCIVKLFGGDENVPPDVIAYLNEVLSRRDVRMVARQVFGGYVIGNDPKLAKNGIQRERDRFHELMTGHLERLRDEHEKVRARGSRDQLKKLLNKENG